VRNADIAEVRKALEEAFLPPTGYQNTYNTLVLRTGGKVVLSIPATATRARRPPAPG
jgi:hypothetical protein